MFKATWVIALCVCFNVLAHANTTATDFSKSKQYAKSLSNQPLNAIHQFKPESTFKDYNPNPSTQSLYAGVETEKTDLNANGKEALKKDPGGQVVFDNFGKSKFEINQANEAIKQAKLIEEESYNITHGISNDRVKCSENQEVQCETRSHFETCKISGELPNQQCNKKLKVAVAAEQINQRVDIEFIIRKKWKGIVMANLVTGAIINPAGGHVSNPVQLTHACENFTATVLSIRNNGQSAYWVKVIGMPNCTNNGLIKFIVNEEWSRVYPIQISLTVTANSKAYVSDEHWENGCSELESTSICHRTNEHCTDANSTHVINGMPVTRNCWETTSTFSCAFPKVDECALQREKNCLQGASTCVRMEKYGCALYDQSYNCFEKICPAPVACVKDLFCADGDCTEHDGTQNSDFAKSIAPMAVAGGAGQEYAKTQASLFSGHEVKCKIWPINFIDCCSDKGWGETLNLAHCRDEDKALGKAKMNYLAHYVGEYCAEKVLGVCVESKRTYCVFDTKMARIIQEEGRLKQLNPNAFGTAENPTCGGMSVTELQSLDMGKIEFLRPKYPFNEGPPLEAAGLVVTPPNTGNINDEVIRRVQKKVGG